MSSSHSISGQHLSLLVFCLSHFSYLLFSSVCKSAPEELYHSWTAKAERVRSQTFSTDGAICRQMLLAAGDTVSNMAGKISQEGAENRRRSITWQKTPQTEKSPRLHMDRLPQRPQNNVEIYYHNKMKEFNAVASCLLRQHVGEGGLYLRGGGETGGRGMCDWQEIPQKDSLFVFLMCFHTFYWFLRLLLISPHSSEPRKQPRFLRGLRDLAFQRCYYHLAGQTVRMRSGQAHSFWDVLNRNIHVFFHSCL